MREERYVPLCQLHVGKRTYDMATHFAGLYGGEALYDQQEGLVTMGAPGSEIEMLWETWCDAIHWVKLYDYLDTKSVDR